MMQIDPDRPSTSRAPASRVSRAVTGVLVGVLGLALVGVVVAVIGYNVLVTGWAAQHDAASSPSGSSATETTDAGGAPAGEGEQAVVGPGENGLDASNEAYRQRVGSPEGDAEAALSIPDVQAALDPLATGGQVDRDAVFAALAAAGFDSVQVTPDESPLGAQATSFGVGVSVPGGCVYGEVAPEAVKLEAGGPIADGGCLEMPTH